MRVPVYPLLLKLCSLPANGAWLATLVCIIQSAMYLISIRSFWLLLRQLVSCQWIVFLVALSYVLLPVAGWCNELLTESLSVSLMVILCHQLLLFHNNPSWKKAFAISLFLLFMVMLRTNFIAFFAILPFVWLWQWVVTKQRVFVVAIAFLLLPIGGYVAYCKAFQQHYGIFAASIATSCDKYNLKNSDLWNVSLLSDPEEIAVCNYLDADVDGSYAPMYRYVDSTGDAQTVANACATMKERQKLLFVKYKVHLFLGEIHAAFHPLFAMHSGKKHTMLEGALYTLTTVFAMPLLVVYQFIILLAFVLLVHFVRHKRLPLSVLLLWCVVAAQCVGIPLKGSDSFCRLLLPIYPIALCLMAWAADRFLSWHRARSVQKQ